MVKKRQAIPIVPFESSDARGLGVEVVGLRQLIAREVRHDLRRPQRPTFHHLVLVTEGRGAHTVDFRRYRLTVGRVLHVAPGQVQQFSLDRALDATMIVFEPHFVRHAPPVWSGPRALSRQRHATVAALFDAVAREYAAFDGSAGSRALLRSLVEALIAALDGPLTDGKTRQSSAPLLARFEAALEKSFARAHEVVAYAAVLDCSPRTLARVCERATGRSAKRAIDERVLLEAKRLLAHGGQSSSEIATQLGFAEATQFGKFFKRLAGETPATFRARFG